ncbi:MAG: lipopolysaccharide transport periplasmic protein LptA [Gammaproteobacteria bacterium]|nr:lipopolysaccharide transport periplasmic protein LptA [Gammaproteobacteria bacterium]
MTVLVVTSHAIPAQADVDETQIRLAGNSAQANLEDPESDWSFDGDVQLERGSLTLTADRMTAKRSKGDIVEVIAEGEPAQFTQTEPNLVTASSSSMTYSVTDETIVLSGEVILLQGGNETRGERIEYDVSSGELIAGSTNPADGQQIEFVLDDEE